MLLIGWFTSTRDSICIENMLTRTPEFDATHHFVGSDTCSGMAIDEMRSKVAFCDLARSRTALELFDYKDILQVEIFEDGETVTRTCRRSQLGGAAIGGAMFGEAGTIAGALSAKTMSRESVDQIELRLTVDNSTDPLREICFHSSGKLEKGSAPYKAVSKKVRHWKALFEVFIRKADAEFDVINSSEKTTAAEAVDSFASAITRLATLKSKGLITEAEFSAQKAKLLE